MKALRRLVVTILFVPVLLWDVMFWGWFRWLLTGKSNDILLVERLKEWAQ